METGIKSDSITLTLIATAEGIKVKFRMIVFTVLCCRFLKDIELVTVATEKLKSRSWRCDKTFDHNNMFHIFISIFVSL